MNHTNEPAKTKTKSLCDSTNARSFAKLITCTIATDPGHHDRDPWQTGEDLNRSVLVLRQTPEEGMERVRIPDGTVLAALVAHCDDAEIGPTDRPTQIQPRRKLHP